MGCEADCAPGRTALSGLVDLLRARPRSHRFIEGYGRGDTCPHRVPCELPLSARVGQVEAVGHAMTKFTAREKAAKQQKGRGTVALGKRGELTDFGRRNLEYRIKSSKKRLTCSEELKRVEKVFRKLREHAIAKFTPRLDSVSNFYERFQNKFASRKRSMRSRRSARTTDPTDPVRHADSPSWMDSLRMENA